MKAILVCVDFSDLLSITLPYNRHHFNEVMVVTTLDDYKTHAVADANGARCFMTQSFYRDGAVFNKFRAMEEGLDALGRDDWLAILDADVLWPKYVPKHEFFDGHLYTPRRRMMYDLTQPIPPEDQWSKFALHPQEVEFAGYSQIFHAHDPHLGCPPWHEVNWRHAGGGDSFFQQKWPDSKKIRPPFEVLHLGEAGINWCGRASKYTDGTTPQRSAEKREQVRAFIRSRVAGAPDPYAAEKLPKR